MDAFVSSSEQKMAYTEKRRPLNLTLNSFIVYFN